MYLYDECKNALLPLTLEDHLRFLADKSPQVHELYSTWTLFKKQAEDEMLQSRNVFSNFSLHDATHSRSVIQAIERLLGEQRIMRLQATDTFMLLVCAYIHDYGMSYSIGRLYDILGSVDFDNFLKNMEANKNSLEREDVWAITNIMQYLRDCSPKPALRDIYYSINLLLQTYLRPQHWQGVINLNECFQGLFEGRLNIRFFQGMEGIVEVCMAHGQTMNEVLKLRDCADGMVGDDYHPRFIAAMLRMGDLLDIDNNRFPRWFVREVSKDKNLIPHLSILHYLKHESISHLRIDPNRIEITAHCHSKRDGYKVADLVCEWTSWLSAECRELTLLWNEIAPADFGRPPARPEIEIYVDGNSFSSWNRNFQMQMSQERVMKLLEGTSIYNDKYVGIREVIQNAIDASLLQLWYDIIQNRYLAYGLSKHTANEGLSVLDLTEKSMADIFGNYDILVELIQDQVDNRVYIVVKDKGIGILPSDVEFIANIGSSQENKRRKDLMKKMPKWMKPAGIFGIGLQSMFQLTDCIEFYTRQPNAPEMRLALNSYGSNRGKIELHEVPSNEDGLFYDNAIPGTNVKIAISADKFFRRDNGESVQELFTYYDPEFDTGNELDMIFAEMAKVIEHKLKEVRYDYFNVAFQTMKRKADGSLEKEEKRYLKRSFFCPESKTEPKERNKRFLGESIRPFLQNHSKPYFFIDMVAYYWDENTNRFYRLVIRPCHIVDKEKNGEEHRQVYLPNTVSNLYHVRYKFCPINNADSIYSPLNRSGRQHAGFLDWDILILDDDPTKYLNIDRERLREGALQEEELLQVRNKILNLWCNDFIEKDQAKTALTQKEGNRFSKTPGALLSLIFLFYQNVPSEMFQKFMEQYQDFLEEQKLVLGNEKVPLTCLWNNKQQFYTVVSFSPRIPQNDAETAADEATMLRPETLTHLPHRLVKVEAISQKSDHELLYRLRLCISEDEPMMIDMDETARLLDYMNVFLPYDDQPNRVNFLTVQKTVFKPNKRFPHLVLSRYPQTFRKGNNFSSSLDYCIRWYILSPFDRIAAQIISKGLREDSDFCDRLSEHTLESVQFNKCVQYILKQRFAEESEKDKQTLRQQIRKEYTLFIKDFCTLLHQNRTIFRDIFS